MKRIILLLAALVSLSCSKEDNPIIHEEEQQDTTPCYLCEAFPDETMENSVLFEVCNDDIDNYQLETVESGAYFAIGCTRMY